MKKGLIALLIIAMLACIGLVSCKNEVEVPVVDDLVSISFSKDSSRALTASLQGFVAGDYYWSYEAQKNDNSGLVSGVTGAFDETGDNATPVQSGKGLVDSTTSKPVEIPGFSKGFWNFRLFAFADENRTQLVYWGKADNVPINENNHVVKVVVSPAATADGGYLKVGTITFVPASTSSSLNENVLVIEDYLSKENNDEWVKQDYTKDSSGKFSVPAGQYMFTRQYKVYDNVIASGSVIVTVYPYQTTEVMGSLNELTTYSVFGPEQNPDAVNVSAKAKITYNDSTADSTYQLTVDNDSTTVDKVEATISKTAANTLIEQLTQTIAVEDEAVADITISNTNTSMDLNLGVRTTATTATSVAYDISMTAEITYSTTADPADNIVKTADVTTVPEYVIVTVNMQPGITVTGVTHSGKAMKAVQDIDKAGTADSTEEGAGVEVAVDGIYVGFYKYVAAANQLIIKTRSFSPFRVEYELPEVVAMAGGVQCKSLEEAFALQNDPKFAGEYTIVLQRNINISFDNDFYFTVANGKTITLDLNGYEIHSVATRAATSALIKVDGSGTLILIDSSDSNCDGTGNGKIIHSATNPDPKGIPEYASNMITNLGTLTIKSGYYEHRTTGGYAIYTVDNQTNGNLYSPVLTIDGGKFVQYNDYTYAIRMFCNSETKANTAVVNGGVISGGYGFWLQTSNAKKHLASLTINGGKFSARNGASLYVNSFSSNADLSGVSVRIAGGSFSSEAENSVLIGSYSSTKPFDSVVISGGSFEKNVKIASIPVDATINSSLFSGYPVKGSSENNDSCYYTTSLEDAYLKFGQINDEIEYQSSVENSSFAQMMIANNLGEAISGTKVRVLSGVDGYVYFSCAGTYYKYAYRFEGSADVNEYLYDGDYVILQGNIWLNNDVSFAPKASTVKLYFNNYRILNNKLVLREGMIVVSDTAGMSGVFKAPQGYKIVEIIDGDNTCYLVVEEGEEPSNLVAYEYVSNGNVVVDRYCYLDNLLSANSSYSNHYFCNGEWLRMVTNATISENASLDMRSTEIGTFGIKCGDYTLSKASGVTVVIPDGVTIVSDKELDNFFTAPEGYVVCSAVVPEGYSYAYTVALDPNKQVLVQSTSGDNYMSLADFMDSVNKGNSYAGCTVTLMQDVDLGLSNEEWTPIGNPDHPFSGTFDGNGKTISNYVVSSATGDDGLFGYVRGTAKNVDYQAKWNTASLSFDYSELGSDYTAVVKNLTVDHASVTTTSSKKATGAVIGSAVYATISNISVKNSTVVGEKGVGGVIGNIDGSFIEVCSTDNNTSVTARVYNAGGIVGTNANDNTGKVEKPSMIYNCSNSATVTLNGTRGYAGGIIALGQQPDGIVIADCHNYGKVKAANTNQLTSPDLENSGIAGIAGSANGVYLLLNCVNEASASFEVVTSGEDVVQDFFNSVAGISFYGSEKNYVNCVNKADIKVAANKIAGITVAENAKLSGCSNEGSLKNTRIPSAVYELSSDMRVINIQGLDFNSISELNSEISSQFNSSGNVKNIVLKDVTIGNTTGTGTLVVPEGIQTITSNVKVCDDIAFVDSLSTINMVGLSQEVSGERTLVFGGSGNTITIAQGTSMGNISLAGNDNHVVNNGSLSGVSVIGSGTGLTIENNGSLGHLSIVGSNSTPSVVLTNNGSINNANGNGIHVEAACTLEINTYGEISASNFAMLLYDGCNVTINAFANSVTSGVAGGIAPYRGNNTIHVYYQEGATINSKSWTTVASENYHVYVSQMQ